MDFEREGRDWPNRDASRFIAAGGLNWHVQIMGEGPPVLLVHGTGASTHSWRHIVPFLKNDYTLIIPDLPGHAFTQASPGHTIFTLPAMADALRALMHELRVDPVVAAGHSAGAAILIRAALDGGFRPASLISLNGALFPFGGAAGQFFSPLAKLMVSLPWVPRFMSWRAKDRNTVGKLLRDLGSHPSDADIDFYARLFRDNGHVAATLAMMANWDLHPLVRDMPRLNVPLTLAAGAEDKAVPPHDAERAAKRVPRGCSVIIPGTGHLSHEERPDLVAALVHDAVRSAIVR